ncbi:MAG: amidohydrolase family protein [Candidatus Bathyarchaeota archaeon]|nr:amidohydrolase family protein [Candidatus Bathyarchaeota archaeon]
MIIDTHTHLGYDYVFEEDFTINELLTNMQKNRVDISIVQPGTVLDLKTVVEQHNAIADLAGKMPGRIFGMANPNPHLPSAKYRNELERCISDLGFVGVKMQTLGHGVDPNKSVGRKVFEAALGLGVPVMVHTGTGIPWSLPSAIIPIAKDFPGLEIVLAHSGGSMFAGEAAFAAQLCSSIYLEASWLPGFIISGFCKTLGAQRIMFGSDHGDNVAAELAKFGAISLTDQELEWCLGKTATKGFKIPAS